MPDWTDLLSSLDSAAPFTDFFWVVVVVAARGYCLRWGLLDWATGAGAVVALGVSDDACAACLLADLVVVGAAGWAGVLVACAVSWRVELLGCC